MNDKLNVKKEMLINKFNEKKQSLKTSLDLTRWEDGLFMDDVRQATLRGAHPFTYALFWTIGALFFIFLLWASFAEIDEVTTGVGKVIPSSQVQTVQNREGGIVEGILVHQGDVVEKGQVLVRVGNTDFSSSLAEKSTKRYTLMAEIARLDAAAKGLKEVQFPEEISKNMPRILDAQNAIFLSNLAERTGAMSALERRVEQKEQEFKALEGKRDQTIRAYDLSKKELDLTKPLLKEGVVSEVEILRLERQVNDKLGEKETAALDVPRANSAVQEAKQHLEGERARMQGEILDELSKKREDFARLEDLLKADTDKVDRGAVRSPVKATVKRVLVNTVGGVITPGMDLVELIPLEDSLLVEANIRPKDIAFLRPQQNAKVKITAYDFSIYGGLDAKLEYIGVDTVTNEDGDAFYQIRVRTDKNYLDRDFLGRGENKLPIIPGMVAQVDILTGKKTVLNYLLKPFNKMKERALHER